METWPPLGFTGCDVGVNGVRLRCVTGGSGPPLVLLHGWPQTGRAWRLGMPPLAERHTVVVPDLRGMGDSERPGSGYAKAEQAEDVRALMRALDLAAPAILVGHDLGGMVAYARSDSAGGSAIQCGSTAIRRCRKSVSARAPGPGTRCPG